MKAASLAKSDRLKRTLRFLRRGGAYTTRQLRQGANIEAVSATVSELRANGVIIGCRSKFIRGRRRWLYMYEGKR